MAATLEESGTAKLRPPPESATWMPQVTTAQQPAVFFQDVIACLHRLEEGQHRLEAELQRMQGLHLGDLLSTDQKPISSSASQQAAASARPAGDSNPKELSAVAESCNVKVAEVQRLEDALFTLDNEKARSLKHTYMQTHQKNLLDEQTEANQSLFHAHNQARGWMVDQPFRHAELDPGADEEARQGGKCVKAWLNRQIISGKFDMFFGLLIFLNSILMVLRLEERGQQFGYSGKFSYKPPLEWVQAEAPRYQLDGDFLWWVELVFIIIFTVELFLRLWVRYRVCFKHYWNYLDAFIVVVAWVEMTIDSLPFNLALLRLLRLMRLTRVVRVVRVMRSFTALRVLVAAAGASVQALIWSVLLIGLILLMSACLMTGLTQGIFLDESVDEGVREQVWRTWGTFGHAYLTLFRWTLTTSWVVDIDLLILGVNPLFGFFVFPFILFVNFALIRIVTAIFIRETFAAHKKDAMTVVEECMRKDNATIDALREIFVEFDRDGNGGVSKEEFEEAIQDPRFADCLKSLDVNPQQAGSLFTLMDHGLGRLSPEELTAGAMDLRASSLGAPIDIATTRYENMKTMIVLRSIEQHVSMMLKFLEHTALHIDDVKQTVNSNAALGPEHVNKSEEQKEVSI